MGQFLLKVLMLTLCSYAIYIVVVVTSNVLSLHSKDPIYAWVLINVYFSKSTLLLKLCSCSSIVTSNSNDDEQKEKEHPEFYIL